MSVEEAERVLSISRVESEEAVKRAYLRLVRQHRPERDPEGFQRVREAYDVLRGDSQRAAPIVDVAKSAASRREVVPDPQKEVSFEKQSDPRSGSDEADNHLARLRIAMEQGDRLEMGPLLAECLEDPAAVAIFDDATIGEGLECVLDLLAHGAHAQAQRLERALGGWSRRAGAVASSRDAALWRLTKELLVNCDLPPSIMRALVRSIREGSYDAAFAACKEYSLDHPFRATLVRQRLQQRSRGLLVPLERAFQSTDITKLRGCRNVLILGVCAFVLIIVFAVATALLTPATPSEQKDPTWEAGREALLSRARNLRYEDVVREVPASLVGSPEGTCSSVWARVDQLEKVIKEHPPDAELERGVALLAKALERACRGHRPAS